MSSRTRNHALLGRMIIRCDMVWDGRVPNGEFTILHVKGNHIRGISCKNLIFQGIQHINVENIDTIGDVTIKGSTSALPIPGLSTWGAVVIGITSLV